MSDHDELVFVEVARGGGSRSRRVSAAPDAFNVIDLTGDDDGGDGLPRAPRLNPRRQGPQRRTPPAFNRSDSSVLGGNARHNHVVIDLTGSPEPAVNGGQDDDPEILMTDARRVRHPVEARRPHGGRGFGVGNAGGGALAGDLPLGIRGPHLHFQLPRFDQLFNILQGRANRDPAIDVHFIDDLHRNSPNLDYARLPFGQPEPQPVRAAYSVKPAREGFTRDNGEDSVVVCPNCDEELEYDPAEEKPDTTPSKRKGRPTKGEHHFWAVKACGHVFCQDCYENRKPSKGNIKAFPQHTQKPTGVVCAVDGCESDVSNKTAWVGIFL